MNIREIYLRYQLIAWPVISGLASILIIVLVIVPQVLGFIRTRGEIDNMDNRSGILEAKAKELTQVDENQAKQDLRVAFSVLPSDMDVPQAVTILQNLIIRSGLTLKNTTFVSGKTAATDKSYQLNMSVAGPVTSIRAFLISLRDAPRIFQVEAINVRFQKSNEEISAEIPITVFYDPKQSVEVSVDTPVVKLNSEEGELLAKLSRIAFIIEDLRPAEPATGTAAPPSSIGKADPFE